MFSRNLKFLIVYLILYHAVYSALTKKYEKRRLQFSEMFDNSNSLHVKRKKNSGKSNNRPKTFSKVVEDITFETDRYNMWWAGPPDGNFFQRANWSAEHRVYKNAIFTMAVFKGSYDSMIISLPTNFKMFLGTARNIFDGDIVLAIESSNLNAEIKNFLINYNITVYTISENLCLHQTDNVFCGSNGDYVPASIFRYYLYEKWAINYRETSLIYLTDFSDTFFQSSPFIYHPEDWFPDYQLVLFQEVYPNRVIGNYQSSGSMVQECYGTEGYNKLKRETMISSGALLGTRNGVLVFSRQMTLQLQEAPGRLTDSRCSGRGVDAAFINWLAHHRPLKIVLRMKILPHGRGAANSLSGLLPNPANALSKTGSLRQLQLYQSGWVLNWDGSIAPVVLGISGFIEELKAIVAEKQQRWDGNSGVLSNIASGIGWRDGAAAISVDDALTALEAFPHA